MKRIVHVVGTGTVGEPLIGLLADMKTSLGIDEVSFHKRTPLSHERAKVESLVRRGAKLTVDPSQKAAFEAFGHKVQYETREALERATVVIDCTPAGNENKDKFYQYVNGPKGFIAQGSEFGFGKPYARGINDEAVTDADRFLQVVSCNTHNIAVLLKSLAVVPKNGLILRDAHFLCMRRANDISQDSDFCPSPKVGKHDDKQFGTHHARDAFHLLATLGLAPRIFSSAVKIPTQYMHSIWFSLQLTQKTTKDEVVGRFRDNPLVAVTEKTTANSVFSFGRDHGYYGRILSQTVVSLPTIAVRDETEVVGFCFTPQDGNALLSSLAAAMRFMYPDAIDSRLEALRPFLFREV
ncbi:MAG: hypothetical protein HYY84_05840 [Deltaproteobacteria bacterium]|nr:hypothetical protein [Deltaproteobacteria bacterium]